MDFASFVDKARENRRLPPIDVDCLVSFDPGHTTGIAIFQGKELSYVTQENTSDITRVSSQLRKYFSEGPHWKQPTLILIEEYRIYQWRAKHHTGSDLLTARIIGGIETLSEVLPLTSIPIVKHLQTPVSYTHLTLPTTPYV